MNIQVIKVDDDTIKVKKSTINTKEIFNEFTYKRMPEIETTNLEGDWVCEEVDSFVHSKRITYDVTNKKYTLINEKAPCLSQENPCSDGMGCQKEGSKYVCLDGNMIYNASKNCDERTGWLGGGGDSGWNDPTNASGICGPDLGSFELEPYSISPITYGKYIPERNLQIKVIQVNPDTIKVEKWAVGKDVGGPVDTNAQVYKKKFNEFTYKRMPKIETTNLEGDWVCREYEFEHSKKITYDVTNKKYTLINEKSADCAGVAGTCGADGYLGCVQGG